MTAGASTSSFYGHGQTCTPAAENPQTWLPGETIHVDCHSGTSATNSGSNYQSTEIQLKEWMHQLVSDMQAAVLGRLSEIDEKINSLSVRVSKLEDDGVHSHSNDSPTTDVRVSQPSHSEIRTRKTPTEIQASYHADL